jgi:hypothetical protein
MIETKETKVRKRQPLKHLNKILLSLEAHEEENKQTNPIELPEEDIQTSSKKNYGQPLGSKNKKNPIASNV